MIKRILLVLVLMLSVAFGINRIDSSKSITTNYLLLSTVEKKNIEQINNVIRFNVDSYSYSGNVMNKSPIPTENGTKVILGSDTDGNYVNSEYKESFNNNYAFPMKVEYNNYTKEIIIEGVEGFEEEPKIEKFLLEGEEVNLVISR